MNVQNSDPFHSLACALKSKKNGQTDLQQACVVCFHLLFLSVFVRLCPIWLYLSNVMGFHVAKLKPADATCQFDNVSFLLARSSFHLFLFSSVRPLCNVAISSHLHLASTGLFHSDADKCALSLKRKLEKKDKKKTIKCLDYSKI